MMSVRELLKQQRPPPEELEQERRGDRRVELVEQLRRAQRTVADQEAEIARSKRRIEVWQRRAQALRQQLSTLRRTTAAGVQSGLDATDVELGVEEAQRLEQQAVERLGRAEALLGDYRRAVAALEAELAALDQDEVAAQQQEVADRLTSRWLQMLSDAQQLHELDRRGQAAGLPPISPVFLASAATQWQDVMRTGACRPLPGDELRLREEAADER